MPHSHNHVHGHSHDGGNIGVAFFLNLAFTVIELIGGLFTNSVAILSDAAHDFGDSLALGLAWYFQKLSRRGSSKQYTYGYKRFSLLGAVINSAVLIFGSVYILSEAIPRFFTPQATDANGMMILAGAGILVNGFAALRTRKASSVNERVVSLHLMEDVLGWAAVLIGSVVMRFTGFVVIDPILSILIACFVLSNVFKNVRQVLPILLQKIPSGIDREHITEVLGKITPIVGIHDLHIWSLDERDAVLTVHVVVSEALSAREVSVLKDEIRSVLENEGIRHVTIELETPGESCALADCVYQ